MKKIITFIIVFILVIFSIFFLINKNSSEESIQENSENSNIKTEPVLIAGTTTPYYEFTQDSYEQAIADDKIILLYFYANWCPICKREQAEATLPAFNELNDSDVIGFRVNYKDDETSKDEEELAKQFGITYQHTKVILVSGELSLKDLNSWDKDKYLQELS